MLSRTLSAIVLVLALCSGAVLLVTVPAFVAPEEAPASTDQRGLSERLLSIPSQTLSRLTMFPIFRRQPVPLAVMIENHEDARPHQVGLMDALMVQEFLVEGFISRFIILVDANNLPASIGPVRSLRPYFLDAVLPWTRTVFHAGGSPEALTRVQNSGEFYALNLLYFDDEDGALRDPNVAPPHNLFMGRGFLQELLADISETYLQSAKWPPYATGTPEDGEDATKIDVNFFSSLHNVTYEFQPLAEKYERVNGGTVTEARPANVVFMEVPIDQIGEYGRLYMTLEGSGKALIFHSGKLWHGRWTKSSVQSSPRFTDSDGKDIPLHHGQTWLTVLPTLERVSWE